MSMWDVVKAVSQPVSNAAGAAYSIYQDIRDFNYRKNLQSELFEREDNAVQRRAADLQAAGMNPYMAAGSAAGAGSPVNQQSKSIGNLGNLLDGAMAVEQLKQAKKQTEMFQEQLELLRNQVQESSWNRQSAYYNFLDREDTFFYNRGIFRDSPEFGDGFISYGHNKWSDKKPNIPFYNLLDYQLTTNRNSADLLQKQNEYYTSDKIMNYVGSFVPFLNMGRNYMNRR